MTAHGIPAQELLFLLDAVLYVSDTDQYCEGSIGGAVSSTQQYPTHPGRGAAAIAVSIVVGPVMIWAALICVVTIIQQVLSGFFDFSQASWTQAFNPAVWFGIESIGGTGVSTITENQAKNHLAEFGLTLDDR